MAGIYIHIPYCKQACHYCNFHFSTDKGSINEFVEALLTEISLKAGAWQDEVFETIYFGGGTPSILSGNQIRSIIQALYNQYNISSNIEQTVECNPDDLSIALLKELKLCGFNRLSIGIQSFFDKHLQMMNRSHNQLQARNAIADASYAGFSNITIDLIYGLPDLSVDEWNKNLSIVQELQVPHLSCYSLTIEERTALAHFVKQNKMKPAEDDLTIKQYHSLLQWSKQNRINQYEISNFAKAGFESKHNSNYWNNQPYLGLGPSAHSYFQNTRTQNKPHNIQYIRRLLSGQLPEMTTEVLSVKDTFNELLLTRLRTVNGLNRNQLLTFPKSYVDHVDALFPDFNKRGLIEYNQSNYVLTIEGQMLSDYIISSLFVTD